MSRGRRAKAPSGELIAIRSHRARRHSDERNSEIYLLGVRYIVDNGRTEGPIRIREGGMQKLILLVEDNDQFREAFARALERALADELLEVVFVEAGSL